MCRHYVLSAYPPKLAQTEKAGCRIWDITSQTDLSVAEVICCVKNNIRDITEDNIIEKVYGEKYDYKTLGAYAQMQDDKYTIINSIVDLYLGKMILFEM